MHIAHIRVVGTWSRAVSAVRKEVEEEERRHRGRSMRVQGSCRTVAVRPVCVLLRAGTDTMKPAVLAGVVQACLVTETHTHTQRMGRRVGGGWWVEDGGGSQGVEESPSQS